MSNKVEFSGYFETVAVEFSGVSGFGRHCSLVSRKSQIFGARSLEAKVIKVSWGFSCPFTGSYWQT